MSLIFHHVHPVTMFPYVFSLIHTHPHTTPHPPTHTHTLAFFCCYVCKETKTVEIDRGRIAEPAVCPHCQSLHSMALIHNRSLFTDKQMIKLQESPGQKPHHPSLLTTLTPSPSSLPHHSHHPYRRYATRSDPPHRCALCTP